VFTELLALYLYAVGAFLTNHGMYLQVAEDKVIRAPIIMSIAWPLAVPIVMAINWWEDRNE
jgi:hypothetical protein